MDIWTSDTEHDGDFDLSKQPAYCKSTKQHNSHSQAFQLVAQVLEYTVE